jgi:hypothetical protein
MHLYPFYMDSGSNVTIKSIGVDLTETAFRLGIITVNEFRRCIGFDPLPDGDVLFDKQSFGEYWASKS